MTITYRATKGSALTYGEVDENFRDLYEDTDITRVLTNGNTTTLSMTVNTITANTMNVVNFTVTNVSSNSINVNNNSIRITTAKTPASATDTGSTGQICWDANYIYVCVATNTWKRSAIATWV